MTPPRIKILHIINSFEFGGAEAMLCNLLLRTDTDRFAPSVEIGRASCRERV